MEDVKKLSKKEYGKKWREENKEKRKEYDKKWREENKERIQEREKEYREENKEKIKERNERYREENKEKIQEREKEYREENKEKIKKYREENKEDAKKWRQENKGKIAKQKKKHYEGNTEYFKKKNKKYREENAGYFKKYNITYAKERRKADPIFAMTLKIRGAIGRFWKGGKYSKSFEEMMGCNLEDFKIYISKQFVNDMSFENQGEWELDHKVPLAIAKTEEELIKLNHFSNFQPLWKEENREKKAKLLPKHKKLMFELIGR